MATTADSVACHPMVPRPQRPIAGVPPTSTEHHELLVPLLERGARRAASRATAAPLAALKARQLHWLRLQL
jgi:hypothetical protein